MSVMLSTAAQTRHLQSYQRLSTIAVMNIPTFPQADSAADQALQLDQQTCFALYSTTLALNKAYRQLLAPLKLTYPQYLVMLVLWQQDGLTVSAIGARLYLDSATLTPLLKRLAQQGYLTRQRAAQDERQVQVYLTDAGQALRHVALDIPPQVVKRSQLSLEQLQQLKAQLEQLRDGLLQPAP